MSIHLSSPPPNFRPRQLQTQPLETVHITEEVVHKKLQSLRLEKSPGPVKLHPRILKDLANELATQLVIIYKCIDKGTTAKPVKRSYSHTNLQKGIQVGPQKLHTSVTYFSSVQNPGRIITESILGHIKSNSIQWPQQHGFTTGRSTTTNLLEAVNLWSKALSHNDYAKAFDTVSHIRFGTPIETFGISGKMLA